jgi:hypothetical protein
MGGGGATSCQCLFGDWSYAIKGSFAKKIIVYKFFLMYICILAFYYVG